MTRPFGVGSTLVFESVFHGRTMLYSVLSSTQEQTRLLDVETGCQVSVATLVLRDCYEPEEFRPAERPRAAS